MTIDEQIRAVQKELGLKVDGYPGKKTWQAVYELIVGAESKPNRETIDNGGLVDARSEGVLSKLEKPVIPLMRSLIKLAAKNGVKIIATSGLRTYAEQNDLYAQGRTKPGKIVTNAKGGYSSHNFGTACDFTIFEGKEPVWESPLYQKLGEWGKSIGLSWGGDWWSPDEPHFYLKPRWAKDMTESQMMAGLRERHTAGNPIFP